LHFECETLFLGWIFVVVQQNAGAAGFVFIESEGERMLSLAFSCFDQLRHSVASQHCLAQNLLQSVRQENAKLGVQTSSVLSNALESAAKISNTL
jgi:hypothetical protein